MINAHTATRTFREMQFDIKAFLYALKDDLNIEAHYLSDLSHNSLIVDALSFAP